MKAQNGFLSFLAVGLALGCASAQESVATEDDALTATCSSYVSIRRDNRECFMAPCGGYWVHELNRATHERYVASLDTSALGWSDEDTTRYFGGAADGAIVVKAHLGVRGALVVEEAYRGMPGVAPAGGDAYYTVSDGGARTVNKDTWRRIDGVDVAAAALPLVDQSWLERRVTSHGAIVAARVDDEKLGASQVFVRLPDVVGPCPMVPIRSCDDGQIMTCTRNADGCMIQQGCVTRGICPLYLPQCADGYTRVSWPAQPNGCDVFACNPSFLAEY